MKLPIPDDWTQADGYTLALVCIPDSKYWRAIVRGQIQILGYGRLWDEKTGSIKAVQAIGREIYESFMTCRLDDLVTSLETLNTTIQAQQAQFEAIVAALGQIQTAITANSSEDLEDDLANVWGMLQSINEVLGGNNDPPPTPL
jgi:hypothetical protein